MTGLGSSCGACKFLRRKCINGCIFAPYFSYDQGATHFAAIHKVFGASNVSKLLLHIPLYDRGDAAMSLSYEAQARLRDPVYGCVGHIFALQQQVANLQEEIQTLATKIMQGESNSVYQDLSVMNQYTDQQDYVNASYSGIAQAPQPYEDHSFYIPYQQGDIDPQLFAACEGVKESWDCGLFTSHAEDQQPVVSLPNDINECLYASKNIDECLSTFGFKFEK
ncbi:LOB domain-containing protein 33-like [Nymphaea colorata]|nr:LOB domain-containing protein 33-like [Nymphaea colorata]